MTCNVKPGAKCDFCGHESEWFTEYDREAAGKPFYVEARRMDPMDIASGVLVALCAFVLLCYVCAWVAHGCPVVP